MGLHAFGQTGILKDRTRHPHRDRDDYTSVDLENLSHEAELYNWTHVRFVCRYKKAYRAGGDVILECEDMSGSTACNLLITAGDTSGIDDTYFNSLQSGVVLELHCLVESTLKSGETVVMIENLIELE
jgi:hypothetical protein